MWVQSLDAKSTLCVCVFYHTVFSHYAPVPRRLADDNYETFNFTKRKLARLALSI